MLFIYDKELPHFGTRDVIWIINSQKCRLNLLQDIFPKNIRKILVKCGQRNGSL